MMICFTNISPNDLITRLGYSFCLDRHILAHFSRMQVADKRINNHLHKSCYFWRQNIGEIDP